jgi:hypothetical protein
MAAGQRGPRSDKGIVREVTRLKNLAKSVRNGLVEILGRPEGLDTPATVHTRKAHAQAAKLFNGLDALDGRMKVRFDPGSGKK